MRNGHPASAVGIHGEAAKKVMDLVYRWMVACEAIDADNFPTQVMWDILAAGLRGKDWLGIARAAAAEDTSFPSGLDSRKIPNLGQAAADAALASVRDYVETISSSMPGIPAYALDPRHSFLLRRLLGGSAALPEAPPRDGLRPWYELVERAGRHSCAVEGGIRDMSDLLGERADGDTGRRLVINDHPWHVDGELPGGGWLVRWEGRGAAHAVRPDGEGWTIERLDEGQVA